MNATEAQEWMEANLRRDPVHCKSCTACCRNRSLVVLQEEWGDDPSQYGIENLQVVNYVGEPALALKFRENGDCFFLRGGKCMVYDKRPAVCRGFDCRRATSSFTEEERENAIKMNVFSREVFEAADKRIHSMRLDPVEKDFYRQAYQPLKGK